MNTNEWKVVGRFVALLVTLYSIVAECFKGTKVPLEILDWLSKEGKLHLQEAVNGLISKYQAVVEPIRVSIKKVKVAAVSGKKTADCFTDVNRYRHRDANLDIWLPEDQPAENEGKFLVSTLMQITDLKKFLDFLLGKNTRDEAELCIELKGRGHTTTLPRIESLIEEQMSGKDVGLLTSGAYSKFLTLDREGNVRVVRVRFFTSAKVVAQEVETDDDCVDLRHDFRWEVEVDDLESQRLSLKGLQIFLRE